MSHAPLIFTPELMAKARACPEERRRLIYRWAVFPGRARELARVQLEQAARLVPPQKRARVLGLLYSDSDKQAFGAAGVLLLAKMLNDQGWDVEHEPEIEGVTPDLRIRKDAVEFLVEARRVAGELGFPAAYQRVQGALRSIRTTTPATFRTIEVDPRAPLRGFKAFLRRVLDEKRPGLQVFEEPGVLISFELILPGLDSEVGVFTGHVGEAVAFDDRPAVRAALDEKLQKYPFPLIVALQGIDTGDLFRAAEEELVGGGVVEIPINLKTGGPAGPARPGRARDSLFHRPGSDAERVRERLEALLPFEVILTDRGFEVRARLLANPLKPGLTGLKRFRPIPSLLLVGPAEMAYHDGDGHRTSREELLDHFAV